MHVLSRLLVCCFIKSIALKLTTSACRVQEWVFEASITFIKCLGGAPGGEGVLVTCSDGNVFDIFLDNPFPVSLWQHDVLVQSADLSADKDALALVDQNAQLVVVDLSRSQVSFCISLRACLIIYQRTCCCRVLLCAVLCTGSRHSPVDSFVPLTHGRPLAGAL